MQEQEPCEVLRQAAAVPAGAVPVCYPWRDWNLPAAGGEQIREWEKRKRAEWQPSARWVRKDASIHAPGLGVSRLLAFGAVVLAMAGLAALQAQVLLQTLAHLLLRQPRNARGARAATVAASERRAPGTGRSSSDTGTGRSSAAATGTGGTSALLLHGSQQLAELGASDGSGRIVILVV